jgi:beta-galactosidase
MAHDFLHDRYDALHDTPMQRRLRELAPMPVGVVFLPWPGMSEKEARDHFRLMRKLGFTCLKQTMPTPEWPTERTLALALEEGILPYWYGEAGGDPLTPALLRKLGLPPDLSADEAAAHPAMAAHQHAILRRRIAEDARIARSEARRPESAKAAARPLPGVVGDVQGHVLAAHLRPRFVRWLRRRYGTVAALVEAWNLRHVGIWRPDRPLWQTWAQVAAGLDDLGDNEYRHLRDIMRFRAETFVEEHVVANVRRTRARDPRIPCRAGGEMGLFLPFASRGTDMQAIAQAMAEGGSFYPSIHLAWHFEEVGFEVARPVFMQAQLAADWAKGVWTATWESTGGPQYFSGGKSPFVAETRDRTPGFTVDENTITQLMLSYLAAGFKGFGFWAWNARTAGWEAGEYALLDRDNRPSARAIRAGRIGQAARRWRRELWQARKEPLVGLLTDWDNEAIWACVAVTGRDHFKAMPVRARIGAARAFIDANVPWEHVTLADLRGGLGPRYRVLYLPAILALRADLRELLRTYVHEGGRLVMDMPGACFDDFGRSLPTGRGSWFESLFGAVLRDFWHAQEIHRPGRCGDIAFEGFLADLEPTSAKVVRRHDNGRPAVTEARTGRGTAVLLNLPASLACWRPGAQAMQKLLVRHALGRFRPPFACDGGVLAYRLAAPAADHYFLINDGPATAARLTLRETAAPRFNDAVTGEALPPGRPVPVDGWSGRWLRLPRP